MGDFNHVRLASETIYPRGVEPGKTEGWALVALDLERFLDAALERAPEFGDHAGVKGWKAYRRIKEAVKAGRATTGALSLDDEDLGTVQAALCEPKFRITKYGGDQGLQYREQLLVLTHGHDDPTKEATLGSIMKPFKGPLPPKEWRPKPPEPVFEIPSEGDTKAEPASANVTAEPKAE